MLIKILHTIVTCIHQYHSINTNNKKKINSFYTKIGFEIQYPFTLIPNLTKHHSKFFDPLFSILLARPRCFHYR